MRLMECMTGKVAGDRQFEAMGGVVERSIVSLGKLTA